MGACPQCKGFGRVIEINPVELVIPDKSLSLINGAIKPFEGLKVYGHCLQDLLKACSLPKIDPTKPWKKLSDEERSFIWDGDPKHEEGDDLWYGIHSFLDGLRRENL